MRQVQSLLETKGVVGALSRDDLETIVTACNNLGALGPGVLAAAQRVGHLVPEIQDDAPKIG
jgi:hypothetical protein